MKIAFWSNSPGKSGVTGNMSCISILSALYEPSDSILFENHSSINNLGSVFLNQNSYDMLQEKNSYFVENGLGRILSYCDAGDEVNSGMIYRTCLSVFDQRVFYLPTGGMNRELMEFRLKRHAGDVMKLLEQFYSTVYIDISSSSLESSREILKEADLIVVNLCQNNQLLSHFFRNYSEIKKKAFYVIGNYDVDSVITKNDIITRYDLPGNMVGTVPYSRKFADALTKGNVIPFLLKNYSCGRKNVNYEFMSATKETVCLLEQMKRQMEEQCERERRKRKEGRGGTESEKKMGGKNPDRSNDHDGCMDMRDSRGEHSVSKSSQDMLCGDGKNSKFPGGV